jgi:hypothetical protein
MKLSLFNKVTDTDCSRTTTLETLIAQIKEGTFEDAVNKVRNAKTPEEKSNYKKQLPAVTVSGTFSARKDSGLTAHSGLIAIDFDKISYQQAAPLRKDQYTYCGFVSASGYGYCVIVKINPAKHRESFMQLADYYMKNYGLIADSSCINESRLRFVSYDPNAFLNVSAPLFKTKSEDKAEVKERKKTSGYVPYLQRDFDECVAYICGNGIDITDTYDNWLSLAFALAKEFGENGRQSFHEISSISTKYTYEIAEKKYNNALATHRGSIGIGTFFYLCKAHGVPFNLSEAHKIAKTGAVVKKSYGTIDGAYKQFKSLEGREPDEDEKRVIEQGYKEPDALPNDDKPNRFELAQQYLSNNHDLWIESFSGRLHDGDKPMDDPHLNSIWFNMNRSGISIKTTELLSMMESSQTQHRDPIDDYFREAALKYDAKYDPMEDLFQYLHTADPENDKALFWHWCLNVPQTFYGESEGYHLTICGNGYLGKTRFLRNLLPEQLRKYFIEPELKGTKDDYAHMCSALIIMQDEELDDAMKDSNKFKRMTSRSTFTYRKAYGRGEITRKRIASTCGTTNEKVLMHSESNRRLLPIEFVQMVEYVAMNTNFDRDRFWGYFAHKYLNEGVTAQMTPEQVAYLDEIISGKFKEADEIKELIEKHFYPASEVYNHGYVDYVTTTEVKLTFPPFAQRITSKQIGSKLYEMGYQKHGMSNKWVMKYRGSGR